jgi:hypothetical protein
MDDFINLEKYSVCVEINDFENRIICVDGNDYDYSNRFLKVYIKTPTERKTYKTVAVFWNVLYFTISQSKTTK